MNNFIRLLEEIQYSGAVATGVTTFVASFSPSTKTGRIDMIDIHPDYARKGLGRSTMIDFEKWVMNQGGTSITGHVLPQSIGFVKKLGYTVSKKSTMLGGITKGYSVKKVI